MSNSRIKSQKGGDFTTEFTTIVNNGVTYDDKGTRYTNQCFWITIWHYLRYFYHKGNVFKYTNPTNNTIRVVNIKKTSPIQIKLLIRTILSIIINRWDTIDQSFKIIGNKKSDYEKAFNSVNGNDKMIDINQNSPLFLYLQIFLNVRIIAHTLRKENDRTNNTETILGLDIDDNLDIDNKIIQIYCNNIHFELLIKIGEMSLYDEAKFGSISELHNPITDVEGQIKSDEKLARSLVEIDQRTPIHRTPIHQAEESVERKDKLISKIKEHLVDITAEVLDEALTRIILPILDIDQLEQIKRDLNLHD